MLGLRRLNSGDWNKPPVLTAARRIFARALAEKYSSRPLGDMASFVNGTSYDRGKLVSGSKPIIRISNITDPSSDYIETIEEFDEKYHVARGDLLVSWSASFKSTMWPGPAGILNQHIFKVTARSGYSRPFIRHAIEAAFDEMQQNVVGIGMMHLRRRDFLGHAVPAPPKSIQNAVAGYLDWIEASGERPEPKLPAEFSEQQRIVAKIKQLAAKIDEARGLRAWTTSEAEALSASFLGSFFHDLATRNPVSSLGDVATAITDGPRKTPLYVEQGVPFVTVQNMVTGTLDFSYLKYITDADHREISRRCKPARGDVLYSKDGATRGRPCYVDTDREFNIFVSVALVKPDRERLAGRYLCHLLNSSWIKDLMVSKSRGDMIPHIVLREIRAFPVPVPPLDEQRRIVAYLDDLQAKVERLKALQAQTAAELDALPPSILDKAFKGEL